MIAIQELIGESALRYSESKDDGFNPLEPRLSKVGLCLLKQVKEALNPLLIEKLPWRFCRGGHLIQDDAERIILDFLNKDFKEEPIFFTLNELAFIHPYGTGHLDILVCNKKTGEEKIIEVKSTSCDSFLFPLPKPHHVMQVHGQLAYYRKASSAELLYLCRGEGEKEVKRHIESFPVDWPTKEEQIEIDTRLAIVHNGIKTKTLPDKLPFPNWECKGCQYIKDCWGHKEKEEETDGLVLVENEFEKGVVSDYLYFCEKKKKAEKEVEILDAKKKKHESYMLSLFGKFKRLVWDKIADISFSVISRTKVDWKRAFEGSGIDLTPFTTETEYNLFKIRKESKD